MSNTFLERSFTAELKNGKKIQVNALRFCSMADDEAGAIRYSIKALNFDGVITITPFINGDVKNQDSNYDEKFWDEVQKEIGTAVVFLTLRTKKTNFEVCTGMKVDIHLDGRSILFNSKPLEKEKYCAIEIQAPIHSGQTVSIYKFAVNLSSENHPIDDLLQDCKNVIDQIFRKGFDTMFKQQAEAWAKKWEYGDIVIEGDVAAQQAIRFNIFQLNQTYTGEDARLNIGPKGFTGEKYGGSTYWDTEAYCVPFYLATANAQVTKNLLIYRYNHLAKAIENVAKLGFKNGAALYPMVTMNGEECHNEWEITFEEIHRNGAIAYAIFNYIRYTGDHSYLREYGLEVLIAISRFWAQRITWSENRRQYVMLGVTGPNEYENNVNNNWYTNKIASWCLQYTLDALNMVSKADGEKSNQLLAKVQFNQDEETTHWQKIIDHIYLPEDKDLGIFLQQDGYLDKEQMLVKDLAAEDRPLNQNWSWDRILRSCFIKQADVLQGLYFFEEEFSLETLAKNYDFYEPRTVHESSLSPCVHSILAARLGHGEKAYEFYLRTARLDLDDYNNDTEDGCHITSMAGTWMSVVEGFAGMRVFNNTLIFNPFLPVQWTSFSFNISFRGTLLNIRIETELVHINNQSNIAAKVTVYDQVYAIHPNSHIVAKYGSAK